ALGVGEAKVNVHGGGIALGHPIGASGARLVVHMVHELARRGSGTAAVGLCGGGGQGEALVLLRGPLPAERTPTWSFRAMRKAGAARPRAAGYLRVRQRSGLPRALIPRKDHAPGSSERGRNRSSARRGTVHPVHSLLAVTRRGAPHERHRSLA